MKVENLEVAIKIGKKEKKFTNMILDNYLDLFANSFLSFKDKSLPYCLVNFTKNNMDINEKSNKMNYDTILQANLSNTTEILTENNIINKYYYKDVVVEYPYLEDFKGQQIKEIGFANYDYNLNDYVLYAYIDVSKYNIIVQENQPIIISRTDKISSDMEFWSNNDNLKAPYHLTKKGLLSYLGMEYERTLPKLYSVGFGVLPYVFINEYLAENLDIEKNGTGGLIINQVFENYQKNDLFPSEKLFPSENLFPKTPTANLLIYKFKMYAETYPDPEKDPVYVDTGFYYTQYKQLDKYGKIQLSIKYERS